jgi:glycosyltransferase involved in cell wall biosynthesis
VTSARRREVSKPAGELRVGVTGNAVAWRDGRWHVHHSFGRIVECLAERVGEVIYSAPTVEDRGASVCDYPLARPNIAIRPGPAARSTQEALKSPLRLLRGYGSLIDGCDAAFLRGTAPLVWTAHWRAAWQGKRVVHWLVGNPLAVLREADRSYGALVQRLGIAFGWSERVLTRIALRASRAYVLANGDEVARLYRSTRTLPVVSTSMSAGDRHDREDTCTGDRIRVLFVGFIRPEKGLEYLIRALPLVRVAAPVELAIVGSSDQFPAEYERLRRIGDALGVGERISWEGYAPFGKELFEQMDRSDVLVLPSLSEGTPRVLVEARARSLPVVSTRVGGIPSSVSDGVDGLLVRPRDAAALAEAIGRVCTDANLRRALIQRGRERVRDCTIERFVDLVVDLLTRPDERQSARPTARREGE